MNILTISHNSDFYYIRPDISLNRDSNDYFCPDGITEITVAPFIYIRMDKAGKAVSRKFAPRYYSTVGYGVNLTAASLIDSSVPQSFLTANSLDNTTYVSKTYTFEEFPFDNFANELKHICRDLNIPAEYSEFLLGKEKNEQSSHIEKIMQIFNAEIEKITRLTSVRTGDYIAIELAPHTPLPIGNSFKFGEIAFNVK